MDVAVLIVLVVLGQTTEPARDSAALVEKLGSPSYAEREATKSLEDLGAKALPALRTKLKAKDLEVRNRARALIKKIEGNLLIQESLVRLDFKDATLDEIVKSLSKQAGFTVGLGGMGPRQMATNLGARRLTLLESQPVPFWKAVDRLCEIGQLTAQFPNFNPQGRAGPQPRLVLAYISDPLIQPSDNHGPFRFNIVSLTYTSRVTFNASERMRAQIRSGERAADGAPNQRTARPPVDPLPAGAPGASEAKNVGDTAVRWFQLRVLFQIVPEPRMLISRAGNPQVLEAVDELGQSLMPTVSDDERATGQMGMIGGSTTGQTLASFSLQLHRPETPGKLIKKLRSTVEVAVSAARSNPLVIPLEGAAGKSFQNEDRRVVVNSIEHDPMQRQDVIELKIDDLDELFPAETVNGPGLGARSGMMPSGFANRAGGDASQWPIQVLTSKGQNVFSQTSFDWDSGRVTLRVARVPQPGEAREIRISSIVRAAAKIPFELHDLPMP